MIRVTMTSELSQQRNDAITYFTCSSISRHWELFFQNRSREPLPPIAASGCSVKFKRNLLERYRDIYGQKQGKKWTILMFGCYLQKTKRFWHAFSPHSSFNLFKNVCERSWRQLQPISRKRDLINMNRGARVSGFVNVSV